MGFDTSRFNIDDLISFFFFSQLISDSYKLLLSDICTLGKILLVMPATNAANERSFSALKRVKTSPFNNWRRKVEPSYDASRPQGQV